MRLPRRVPWASLSELDQLCSWIFADENDWESKLLAAHRLSAWKASTSLPHALESTLSLLAVILQDSPEKKPTSYLALRQSYSTALIRLVNGLVDPLQAGVYARSIAAIAAQLGLPLWLVELRHAATHEDLPSIELLRQAARDSMSWLLHNYFLPTLNPASASLLPANPLRPLGLILKQYKRIMKLTTRDVSLKTQYNVQLKAVMADVERWVSEAQVAAGAEQGGYGCDKRGYPEDFEGNENMKERWALSRTCDALMEKGALVPISKKKRLQPEESYFPPMLSVQLWSPLIKTLESNHPDFPQTLATSIATVLVADIHVDSDNGDTTPDASFRDCLARWVMWIVETWQNTDVERDFDLRREVIMTLVLGIGPGHKSASRDKSIVMHLLKNLCGSEPDLYELFADLYNSEITPTSTWDPDNLSLMDARLEALRSLNDEGELDNPQLSQSPTIPESSSPSDCGAGWRLLKQNLGWTPTPIGVYGGRDHL